MPADSTQSLSKTKKILFLMLAKISAAYVIYTLDANRGFQAIEPELYAMRKTSPSLLALFCEVDDMALGPYPANYSNVDYLVTHPRLVKFSTFFNDQTGYGVLIFLEVIATIVDLAVLWLTHQYNKRDNLDARPSFHNTQAPTCLQSHLKSGHILFLLASQVALPLYATIIFYSYWFGSLTAGGQICDTSYYSRAGRNSSVFSNPYPISTSNSFFLELPIKMIELIAFLIAQLVGSLIMCWQSSPQNQYTPIATHTTDPFAINNDDNASLSVPANDDNPLLSYDPSTPHQPGQC
jgi:hypothetical protein